ncbi:Lsr2 family protein [Cryobacterium sp. Y11]|jgi:hypothetical protein|uniref:histone-like nucleoid-structuring protein Lsr2 n=1 Tax=Cryobacterium sp. Y11 TaxID=2045016 RepID=UPI001E40055A|nr:Lsr2 family protein [Cryobacterium sp. Y11]
MNAIARIELMRRGCTYQMFSFDNIFDNSLEKHIMKQTTVQVVDDLDGSVIANGSGASVAFALEGESYEIDLSDTNLSELRAVLQPYLSVARRVGYVPAQPRGAGAAKSDRAALQAIREWAAANGVQVSDRGRIAATVREAYANAHSN